MRALNTLHRKQFKSLLPLLATVLGVFTPLMLGAMPAADVQLEEEGELGFNIPDKEQGGTETVNPPAIDESIYLDPELLDQYTPTSGYDLKVEDIAYAYSTHDKKHYVVAAGKQHTGTAGTTNTTWAFGLFEINETSPVPDLIFKGWAIGSSTYMSAWSSVVIGDIDHNGEPDMILGGNVTRGGQVRGLYRRYYLRYPITSLGMVEWEASYGSWNTTVTAMKLGDVNGDGNLDLISTAVASWPPSSGDRSIVFAFDRLYLGIYAYSGWNNYVFDHGSTVWSAVWNDIDLVELNGDYLMEIVLGGYQMAAPLGPKCPMIMTLNCDAGAFTYVSFDSLGSERELVKEVDFERYTMGTNPDGIDGWSDDSSIHSYELKTKKMYGDHFEVLSFADTDPAGDISLSNTFTATSNASLELDMAFEDPLGCAVPLYFYSSSGEFITGLWMGGGQFQVWNGLAGSWYQPGIFIEKGTWYRLGFNLDCSAGSSGVFNFAVNGHVVTPALELASSSARNLQKVYFFSSGASPDNKYYVDNFKVYSRPGFTDSEVKAMDVEDVNQDGLPDVVCTVNHKSALGGNYSAQVVIKTRQTYAIEETFEKYKLADINNQGFWRSSSHTTCSANVIRSGTNNVLQVTDGSNISGLAQAWWELPGTVPGQGEVSFRIMTNNSARPTIVYLADGIADSVGVPSTNPTGSCRFMLYNNLFQYYNGNNLTSTGLTATSNTWYDIKILYRLGSGWTLAVNGAQYGMSYGITFTGNPTMFDHVEIATWTGSSFINWLAQLDDIDLSWATEPFQAGFTRGWTFSGNAALESRADASGTVMVLKRNDGSDKFDMVATPTRAMASGFDEYQRGTIEFWAKSVRAVAGPFQLLNLYQRDYASPNFFRLAVDGAGNIGQNWSTAFIDSGANWVDGVWHRIRVDVSISGAAWDSYVNVTYDGKMIFNNRRCEDCWQRFNNASIELSPKFAGELYVDDIRIDLDPEGRKDGFDLFLKTPTLQAGMAGARYSTYVKDVIASNPDEDPDVEIQLGFNMMRGAKSIPCYHKLAFKDGGMEFEGEHLSIEHTQTAYAARLVEGPIKEGRTRYLIVGANFYWGGAYTKYYHWLSVLDLLPEKQDRGSLADDDASMMPVIASHDTLGVEYVDMKAADVDLDGRNEIILLSNDIADAMHPFTLQVYRKVGGQVALVASQRIYVNPAFGGYGFSMRDMLIKDIDGDGILEIVVTGAVYDMGYNKWGINYMLQYNTDRRFDTEPFFVNNTIMGSDPFDSTFPYFPYRFQDGVGGSSSYYTEFLAIDAMDLDYDGIDEIVCAGHYWVGGLERPGYVIMDFDGTKYVATASKRTYRDYHTLLSGRISTVKVFDIDMDGDYEILTGGNSTNFTAGGQPNYHADVRMMEVSRTSLAITDRRMAVWMVYTTGSYAYYWKTYDFVTGLPGYVSSYRSSVNDLEVTDLDFDGTPEICTVGSYTYIGSGNVYGATHVMRWNGTDFVLRNRNLFYDQNNYKTEYLDMDVENVDYDLQQELFIGGTTSANQERNHDMSVVVNPLSNSSLYYYTVEGYATEDVGHIVINEFFTGTPDAVEFYNQGPTQLMTGWTIAMYDSNAYWGSYSFPAGFTFNSETIVTLYENAGNDSATELYYGSNLPWANRQMAVGLLDPSGRCVDWLQTNGYTGPLPLGVEWAQDIQMMLSSSASAYRWSYWDRNLASDFANSTSHTLGALNPGQPASPPWSKTVAVEICDVDADGVLEMLSLVYSEGYGWRFYVYNKTVIDDDTPPVLVSLGDATNLVGGNVTLFHDDFDSTAIRWEKITGLWHYTGYWSSWPNSYHSYGQSMWFGQESTGNYDTGYRERGSIVSMPIDLSSATSAFLEFYHWRSGQSTPYDQSYVSVSTDRVTWSAPIYQTGGNIDPWQRKVIDLSAYAGFSDVWLNFTFDTINSASNQYRGWLVDDVKVYTNVQTVTHEFLLQDQSSITLTRNNTGAVNPYTFSPAPWGTSTRDDPWQYVGVDTIHLGALRANALSSVLYTATDGLGNTNSMSVPFYYDTKVPQVILADPINGTYISTLPSFSVTISDLLLDYSWYEIFNTASGSSFGPYYFSSNGSMDPALWDSLPQNVLFCWRFFARDKAGNVGSCAIQFKKSTIEILTVYSPTVIVRGQTVLVGVEVWNRAGTDAIIDNVGLIITNSGWDYSIDYVVYKTFPTPYIIPAGGLESFEFEVTAQEYATCGLNMTIDAWVSGSDMMSGDSLYRGFSFVKSWWIVQSKADVQVVQIFDVLGRGVYVEGETFEVRLQYVNYGDTGAWVDCALTFEWYGFLSHPPAAPIFVPAGHSEYQTFSVTVNAGAWNTYVSINFTASGTEDITGRFFTVRSSTSALGVYIQSMGNLAIQDIALVTPRTPAIFVGGESFQIRVSYLNTGGTSILGVSAVLSSTTTYITWGTAGSVTVPAFGNSSQVFTIYVGTAAPNLPAVQLDATASGTEQYTGRSVSDATTSANDLDISIQAQANLQIVGITDRTASSPYIGGETFVIRVEYRNTGGTAVTNLVSTVSFNGYLYTSANGSSVLTVPATGSPVYQDFSITLSTSATTQNPVIIDVSYTAKEQYSERPLNGATGDTNDLEVPVQARANVFITNVVDMTVSGPYIGGETFVIRVNYQNTGGTNVLALLTSLSFNGYAHLSNNASGSITVSANNEFRQDFLITVATGATSINPAIIDASFTATEQYSGRPLSGATGDANDLEVAIQSRALVSVISIEYTTGAGVYVGGMVFNVRVRYQNMGGTLAQGIDSLLNFNAGGYGYITQSNPTVVNVAAGGGTNYQDFQLTISSGATTAGVLINATWSGTEQYSGRVLNGNAGINTCSVIIQAQAAVSITSVAVSGLNGPGPYVGGMNFTVRVTLSNTAGGTSATIDSTLSFGSYTHLNSSNPAAVLISPLEVYVQEFTITVSTYATTAAVTITATWTGIESISGRTLSGDVPADTVIVNIQSQANTFVDTVTDITNQPQYLRGQSFIVEVVVRNTGGTQVTNGTLRIYFNPTGDLSPNMTQHTGLSISASGSRTLRFNVTVLPSALPRVVTINANFTCTESISGRALSDNAATTPDTVSIFVPDSLQVTVVDITNQPAYVRGYNTFLAQVTITNNDKYLSLSSGTLNLIYGSTGFSSSPTSYSGITIDGQDSVQYTFNVSIGAGATTGSIFIDARFIATKNTTGSVNVTATTTDTVVVQAVSNLAISSIVWTTGSGTYVGGMNFGIRVNYQNTGGTAVVNVDSQLTFGGYSSISQDNPSSITVGASGTGFQDFTVTLFSSATPAVVTIGALWSGTEQYSNRPVSGNQGANTLSVTVQSQAAVSITNMAVSGSNGPGPYVGGMSFTVTVTFGNTGGTSATVDATLSFGSYTQLSQDNPGSVLVAAAGTQDQAFSVGASAAATTAVVVINATWSGTETISGRALSGNAGSSATSVSMQSRAAISITNIAYTNGTGTYVGGMAFTARVTFGNTGGTAATVDATLVFNSGTYMFLSQSDPAGVSVAAGGTQVQDFLVSVSAAATTASVTVNATYTATEAISSRAFAGNAGGSVVSVSIQSRAQVSITSVQYTSGSGTYVGGMSFTVRVSFSNTGGTLAQNVDSALTFGGYTGLTPSDPVAVSVAAAGSANQDFTITASAGASTAAVTITATWTGTEAISGRSMSGDTPADTLVINMQAQANVAITSLAVTTPRAAPGPYVGGESFTLRVTFGNTGGTVATVDATLDDGSYSGLTFGNPGSVAVAAGGTQAQDHGISSATGASTAAVTITATWT
ncbi:MAG: lamin tail domain-containing protein, partial [Candidatus Lokiarchaeota archaeon]|nr:lamin tail domain-containing protein [Candidatus Lokiarchaeota archaeon]